MNRGMRRYLEIRADVINLTLVVRAKYNTILGLNFRPVTTLVIKILHFTSLSSLLFKHMNNYVGLSLVIDAQYPFYSSFIGEPRFYAEYQIAQLKNTH